MHNRIDIENTRNRAIVREIGERLYVSEAVRVAETRAGTSNET
ncbi:hypothetical protein M2222_008198 [Bradyrhizobium elkanii]|jgi:hypothetical protein|nr:hypothetical protein [Bradyrhizobium elkanii]MCS3565876.1 hypothetical protein [Bradyrhizobium elkanii]MCW2153394.1 hypothetical protein [Bradyrhizobium elkanii]MCW2356919.1 hypothetical protein [Bradyrhizobium elkanii]MCW2377127.1 hypothetical protein [Bradyrhizobium elkanii]